MQQSSPPPATGYFEEVQWREGRLLVSGWMFDPEGPLERIALRVDGRELAAAPPGSRPDVAASWGWIAHADRSGFVFTVPTELSSGRIDLIGRRGTRATRLSSFFGAKAEFVEPAPPVELSERATLLSGSLLRLQGLRIFTDLHDQIVRFTEGDRGTRLLDWGCGSGRVSAHFIHILGAQVFGADIDAEAIEWCRGHLGEGNFAVVGAEPPLPYVDDFFDIVVGCSVFTHLSEKDQRRWLVELARIVRPGGLLLATTHGEFAYRQALNRPGRRWWRRLAGSFSRSPLKGIVDHGEDAAFVGIAPPGHYRNVYQSRQHTVDHWSGPFQVLDYIERGVDGFQDLVVLRR